MEDVGGSCVDGKDFDDDLLCSSVRHLEGTWDDAPSIQLDGSPDNKVGLDADEDITVAAADNDIDANIVSESEDDINDSDSSSSSSSSHGSSNSSSTGRNSSNNNYDDNGIGKEPFSDPIIESYLERARSAKSLQRMFDCYFHVENNESCKIPSSSSSSCRTISSSTQEAEGSKSWDDDDGKTTSQTKPTANILASPATSSSYNKHPFYIVHLYSLMPLSYEKTKKLHESSLLSGFQDDARTVEKAFFICTMSDGEHRCDCLISSSSLSYASAFDGENDEEDNDKDKNATTASANKVTLPATSTSSSSSSISSILPHIVVSIQGFLLLPASALPPFEQTVHDGIKDKNHLVCIITRYQILHKTICGPGVENMNNRTMPLPEVFPMKSQDSAQLPSRVQSFNKKIRQWHQNPFDLHKWSPSNRSLASKCTKVSDFLERHTSLMSLQKQRVNAASPLFADSDSCGTRSVLPGGQAVNDVLDNYSNSVKEHEMSERQEIKRRNAIEVLFWTNDDKNDNSNQLKISQVKAQGGETLDYALKCCEEALSPELLLRWHAWLAGDGLYPGAGTFRVSDWSRLNDSSLSDRVPESVSEFCDTLEKDWLPVLLTRPNDCSNIATFGVFAMLRLYHCTPFEHGNVDLAMIVFQWAIRRAGFPFCVQLTHGTDVSTLSDCFKVACEMLSSVPCGTASNVDVFVVSHFASGIGALIESTIESMAQSIDEFSMTVSKKALCASEESEARVVRKARERASQATCIICLDDSPNIATLCCGKPVHFHCMGEWLSRSTASTCPQCRSHIQSHTPNVRSTNLSNAVTLVSDDDSSVVEELLHYITNNSDIDSNSSDDSSSSSSSGSSSESSSSSSSSSTTSSVFVYNELHYSLNYITSDEEDDIEVVDEDSSSAHTDVDGTDTENYLAPDDDTDAHHVEWPSHRYRSHHRELPATAGTNDGFGVAASASLDTDIVEDSTISPSTIGEFSLSSSPRILNYDDNERSEDGTQSNSISYISAAQSPPRMSFLDQALLDDVNYGSRTGDDREGHAAVSHHSHTFTHLLADSSSTDDNDDIGSIYDSHSSEIDVIPRFARPPIRQTDRILSIIALHRGSQTINLESLMTGGRWLPSSQHNLSDSDLYDSETHDEAYDDDDVTTEDDSTSSAPPSPLYYATPLAILNRRVPMLPQNVSDSPAASPCETEEEARPRDCEDE